MAASDNTPDRARDYPRWAREVRRDKLPTQMREHLEGVEEFFDHYAPMEEEWRRRNSGYHNRFLEAVPTKRLPAATIWRLQLAQLIAVDACVIHGVRE